jgi:hypothetical protein
MRFPARAVRELTSTVRPLAWGLVVAAVLTPVIAGPWGLAVSLVALGALVALALVTTRRPSPWSWDDGQARTDVPQDLDRSTWFVPGGLLLGWAVDHGHLSPAASTTFADRIERYRAGTMTGPQLYRSIGGVLADDLLDESANEFFTDELEQVTSGLDRRLGRAYPDVTFFEIPDDRVNQERVNAIIESAYARWYRLGRFRVVRHLRRLRASWRGPQRDHFSSQVVQWFRHRRWR